MTQARLPTEFPISTVGLRTISSKKSKINCRITQCLSSEDLQCQGINCTCIGQNATSSLAKDIPEPIFPLYMQSLMAYQMHQNQEGQWHKQSDFQPVS